MEEQLRQLWVGLRAPFLFPFFATQRIFILYLVSALVIAFWVYTAQKKSEGATSESSFIKYCFPASIYKHRSACLDYLYFIINKIIFFAWVIPLMLSSKVVSDFLLSKLNSFENPSVIEIENPLFGAIFFTCALALAFDLALFTAHYLQHKVPVLWEFHKVHHSAAVLTPITVYRMHPVDDLLSGTCVALLTGAVSALLLFFAPSMGGPIKVMHVNAVVFAYYILGFNLRHSHIWFSYGPILSRILISPAQHQVHHSHAKEHRDKNIGFIFSFWDQLCGSLVIPERKLDLQYGLAHHEEKEFSSLGKLYLLPFQKVFNLIRKKVPLGMVFLLLLLGGTRPAWSNAHSVFIEDLTWVEVRGALKEGKTTVIIPTGGVEQNGPHMVLGKHNYVVKHAAEKIAGRLGDSLVAPVMSYVPEGEIKPPSGHMKFAGTISLRESVFEDVLEDTVLSLAAHGFKTFYFLGDSFNNQKSQEKMAKKLTRKLAKKGVIVFNLSRYYNQENGQVKWLQDEGESMATIGRHAGIRDTSELMFVYPEGVRSELLAPNGGGASNKTGVSGDPTRADPSKGEQMMALKINAALKQIQSFEASVTNA